MTLLKIIQIYLKEKESLWSALTHKRRTQLFKTWVHYLNHHGIYYAGDLNQEVIKAWRLYQKSRGILDYTIYKYSTVLFGFLDWLYQRNYILSRIIELSDLGKSPPCPKRKALSVEAMQIFFDREEFGKTYPLRNLALAELLYGSGIRVSESAKLNVQDIEGDHIRVMGKGSKERLVPLGVSAKKALLNYLNKERSQLSYRNIKEKALFIGQKSIRLSSPAIGLIFRVQMGGGFSPHQLRHACASHMLKAGCDVRHLQKLLGHEKLSTTQIYTHVEIDDLKQMVQTRHPRGLNPDDNNYDTLCV